MRVFNWMLAGAALALSAGAASASTVTFANSVTSFTQGSCIASDLGPLNGNDCLVSRSDSSNALGAPDGGFVSLGFGGEIILGFAGSPFPGGTTTAYEITFNRLTGHDEAIEVYSVLSGVVSGLLGTITNTPDGTGSVMVGGAFDSIRLLDVTLSVFADTTSFDGFDVDAVSVSPIPLPAAGIMLLAGLGGLAAMRRKKS